MIIDKLQEKIDYSKKIKDYQTINISSEILDEINAKKELKGWREGDELKVIKKMIKEAEKELSSRVLEDERSEFRDKLKVLNEFVPKELTFEEVNSRLIIISQDIIIAKTKKQKMAIAMKYLKDLGFNVDPKDVELIVKKMSRL